MSIGQLCQADDFHTGAKKCVKLSPMKRDSWLIGLANNFVKIASPGFWKCWDIGVMKMVIFRTSFCEKFFCYSECFISTCLT